MQPIRNPERYNIKDDNFFLFLKTDTDMLTSKNDNAFFSLGCGGVFLLPNLNWHFCYLLITVDFIEMAETMEDVEARWKTVE